MEPRIYPIELEARLGRRTRVTLEIRRSERFFSKRRPAASKRVGSAGVPYLESSRGCRYRRRRVRPDRESPVHASASTAWSFLRTAATSMTASIAWNSARAVVQSSRASDG